MKKIILSGLLAGLIMFFVNMVVSKLFGFFAPGLNAEYTTPGLFRPWSDPLMSLIFIHPFIVGILLAWVWNKTKSLFTSNQSWKKGLYFGLAYWVVTSIPGMLISYSTFPVSLLMIISWTVAGLAEVLVAGLVYSKMIQ